MDASAYNGKPQFCEAGGFISITSKLCTFFHAFKIKCTHGPLGYILFQYIALLVSWNRNVRASPAQSIPMYGKEHLKLPVYYSKVDELCLSVYNMREADHRPWECTAYIQTASMCRLIVIILVRLYVFFCSLWFCLDLSYSRKTIYVRYVLQICHSRLLFCDSHYLWTFKDHPPELYRSRPQFFFFHRDRIYMYSTHISDVAQIAFTLKSPTNFAWV